MGRYPFSPGVLAGVILQPWYSLVVGFFLLVVDVSAEERQSMFGRRSLRTIATCAGGQDVSRSAPVAFHIRSKF